SFKSGNENTKDNPVCDISGIFGCICAHGIPFSFRDIDRGEGLKYAVSILRDIKEVYSNTQIALGYDIMCKLQSSMRRHELTDLSPEFGFIPILHAYGHKEDCQVNFSVKWKLGFGTEYGEEIESFWSELNPFTCHTTHMLPENRRDSIESKLNDLAQKKMRNVLKFISSRTMKSLKYLKQGDLNNLSIYKDVAAELLATRRERFKTLLSPGLSQDMEEQIRMTAVRIKSAYIKLDTKLGQ
ncbi:hypothetical protein ROZALSC1DRAFT_26000, partial [Rozella allomycis CSF55]